MIKRNKLGLDLILEEIKNGLNPSQISNKYNIPKQTLTYSLDKLKRLECIEKIGYATWKVLKEVPKKGKGSIGGDSDFSKKEIRGHAFIWKIEFVEPYDWKKIIKSYKKKKLTFNVLINGKILRTIFKNRKIWFTRRGLTVYEPLDFLGISSFQVKGAAVYELDRLIKELLKELGLKVRQYRFTTSREHYGMIKNELARQFNDRKEKMIIRGEDGTAWLWIDDSKGLGELETGDPHISRKVQNFWNGHKKHNFEVGADFITQNFKESATQIQANAEGIKENAKSNKIYGDNSVTHVALMKKIDANLDKQTKFFEEMRDFILGSKKNG